MCVSIIIPTFNPGPFLRVAIESVHRQSLDDWELVVVDDSSSENLSWVSQEFPRARLLRQAHGGASVARNSGILNTSRPYIAFIDQDDVWMPRKLEWQVEAMSAKPEAAVCYCDLEVIDSEGVRVGGDPQVILDADATPGYSVELSALMHETGAGRSPLHTSIRYFSSRFVVPSTVMLRRSALATSGLLDPFIPFSGDYDLLIKLGSRHPVLRVAATGVLYRKHENNFSDQYEVGRREVEALIDRYMAVAKATGDRQLAREVGTLFRRPSRMYSAQAFDRARRGFNERDYPATVYHLWRAFLFNPLFVAKSILRWRPLSAGKVN